MGFNENITKTFDRTGTAEQILNQEFNAYHKSTFQYELAGGEIKVTGAAYLVNWLSFLLDKETAPAAIIEEKEPVTV